MSSTVERVKDGRPRRATAAAAPRSPAERAARGKAARAEVPRGSHAALGAVHAAQDPVTVLEEQAATRVPELVPIRYGRMLASPFAFYRGAAASWRRTWRGTPRSGIRTQLCGDAHLSNFGGFASPERELVFDINDFDETLPGPVGVGRQAARGQLRDRRARPRLQATPCAGAAVLATVAVLPRGDARASRRCATLDVWYARLDAAAIVGERRPAASIAARARRSRGGVAKAHTQGQHARVLEADPRRRRRAAHRRRPAADRADRGAAPAAEGTTVEDEIRGTAARLPEQPVERSPAAARELPLRGPGAQGRRRRQRRHARLDRAPARARRRRIRCSSRSRRRRPRCSRPIAGAARQTATRASGSSTASG